jgi:hypothetical protein
VTEFRFYKCEEVRCPRCGTQLEFIHAQQDEPLLMRHPQGRKCALAAKRFYAAPLVVELTEFKETA